MTVERKGWFAIGRKVLRAAGAAALVAALFAVVPALPAAYASEDGAQSAEDAAAAAATDQAISQAVSQAASQAAEDAANQAASRAAAEAANEATARAANQAEAQAVAGATDQAATSITDQTATSISEQASRAASRQSAGHASERAAESATSAAASAVSSDQTGRTAEHAGSSVTDTAGNVTESTGIASGDSSTTTAENSTAQSESDSEGETEETASKDSIGERVRAAAVTAALDVVDSADGSEVAAHEVVVLLNRADEPAIRKLNYNLVAQTSLNSLGSQLLRLRLPNGTRTADALRAIMKAAPSAVAAPNHVFRAAGANARKAKPIRHLRRRTRAKFWKPWRRHMAARWVRPLRRPEFALPYKGVVGVIDTPVDLTYPGLAPAVVNTRSFADGTAASAAHGTAVAELIARQRVRVIAANVFAKDEHGLAAATTDSILRALNWLVANHVAVINMSMEGPLDGALRTAIARAQARGCIVVAAAGNRGPAAPPSYPGAFPAVVAVTAIDRNDHIYPYANQGPYISFAALGVDVETASPPTGKRIASGTSFAAPVVAALMARLDRRANARGAHEAVAHLVKAARHLGPPGRNPVFGYGAVGPGVLTTD